MQPELLEPEPEAEEEPEPVQTVFPLPSEHLKVLQVSSGLLRLQLHPPVCRQLASVALRRGLHGLVRLLGLRRLRGASMN